MVLPEGEFRRRATGGEVLMERYKAAQESIHGDMADLGNEVKSYRARFVEEVNRREQRGLKDM